MGFVTGKETVDRPVRRTRLAPAERRASILAAATEVFGRVGYQKAKMSDVAAAVGVTEPVVFQNFGTKAGLYVAVIERAGEHAREAFARRTWHGTGVRGALEDILSPEHIEAMHTGSGHGVLFADAMSLIADPEIGAAARQAVGVLSEALTEMVSEGIRTGELRADLDSEVASWSILSLMASYYFRVAVMPDRAGLQQGISDLVLRALAGEDRDGAAAVG
ncbi:TetR/AcrR family transcriptional regulator [Actinospica durhamensis]|uniref:TetR/AcrR family transcriptional regulator n=1 Tax=Actinospica durhamensis TaxID=1508375 RepID=UPI002484D4FB|nr:TetR/AcrR family transcriptional regulator [Actinospica durhamensis]